MFLVLHLRERERERVVSDAWEYYHVCRAVKVHHSGAAENSPQREKECLTGREMLLALPRYCENFIQMVI